MACCTSGMGRMPASPPTAIRFSVLVADSVHDSFPCNSSSKQGSKIQPPTARRIQLSAAFIRTSTCTYNRRNRPIHPCSPSPGHRPVCWIRTAGGSSTKDQVTHGGAQASNAYRPSNGGFLELRCLLQAEDCVTPDSDSTVESRGWQAWRPCNVVRVVQIWQRSTVH